MHINNHPILGERLHDPVTIYFNGNPLRAYKQQTVAAALIANGGKKIRGKSKAYAGERFILFPW